MYERSAIVLERYIEKILRFDKQYNLKNNYNNFKELIEELEKYQIIATKEGKIIQEFDDTVRGIENIQKEQEKIYKSNLKLEEERNKLFNDLDENPTALENKFSKIEITVEKNNDLLKNLRSQYTNLLSDFIQRQKERNRCEKERRVSEANHIEHVKEFTDAFNAIDLNDILILKQTINSEKEIKQQEISNIMIKNGKNEKVGFDHEVLKSAIDTRMDIAEREAICYISIYDKMKKLLAEIDNDNLKLNKYKKALRDISVKLDFLKAEKEYIVGFLDYERMTAISGIKVHKKMMEEACKNFESDIIQINNLYELILREIANKATKKAYRELYNKTYLKNIEDKEKNFEQEVNSIKINMGTVINSNYWRIEGIKNIYDVFQNEVSEKFEKDLSEFRDEDEIQENEVKEEIINETDNSKKEFKLIIDDAEDTDINDIEDNDLEDEDIEEFESDDEEYEYNEDDEIVNEDGDDYFDEEEDDLFDDDEFLDEDYDDDEIVDKDGDDYFDDDEDDFFEDDDIESDSEEFKNNDDYDENEEEFWEDNDFFGNEEDEGNEEEEELEQKDLDDEQDFNDGEEDDEWEKTKIEGKNSYNKNIDKKSREKNKKAFPKHSLEEKKTGKRMEIKEAKSNKGIFDKLFKDKKEKSKGKK